MSGLTVDGSSKNQTKSTLTIIKATFTGNEAKNTFDLGGGQYGDGGAVFLGWNSTMILQGQQGEISFTDNKAATTRRSRIYRRGHRHLYGAILHEQQHDRTLRRRPVAVPVRPRHLLQGKLRDRGQQYGESRRR